MVWILLVVAGIFEVGMVMGLNWVGAIGLIVAGVVALRFTES